MIRKLGEKGVNGEEGAEGVTACTLGEMNPWKTGAVMSWQLLLTDLSIVKRKYMMFWKLASCQI